MEPIQIEFCSLNFICIISVGGILKNNFIFFFQKLNFWVILCICMIEFRPRNLICVSSVGEIKKNI